MQSFIQCVLSNYYVLSTKCREYDGEQGILGSYSRTDTGQIIESVMKTCERAAQRNWGV
jgi:hypothetical protein